MLSVYRDLLGGEEQLGDLINEELSVLLAGAFLEEES